MAVAASILGSYMSKPTEKHIMHAKRALQYLNAVRQYTFTIKSGVSKQLSVYVDSSGRSPTEKNRRSQTGILVYFGEAVLFSGIFAQKRVKFRFREVDFFTIRGV